MTSDICDSLTGIINFFSTITFRKDFADLLLFANLEAVCSPGITRTISFKLKWKN